MNLTNEIINQAVDAFTAAETVAQVGMIKMTGGIALYAAHIRQMDKQAVSPQPKVVRDAIGREV